MYVHFVFLSSANLCGFSNSFIQKENISCIPRCVFFMCGVHFQAANDTANAAMSLLTAHVMKQFLYYFIKCLNKKKLLNKRLKYELTCSSMGKILTGHEFKDRQSNGRRDRRTRRFLYVVYIPKLCQGRYNNKILLHYWVILKRCLLITEIITQVTRKYHEERE